VNKLNERIRLLREGLKLSRAAFGKKLGVSGDVINNLERGRVPVKESMVKLICSCYDANEAWLRTGSGEPFNDGVPFSLEQRVKERGYSHRAYVAIEKLLTLDPDVMERIVDYCLEVADALRSEEPKQETLVSTAAALVEAEVVEKKLHRMTDEELHAELDRQLAEEKEKEHAVFGFGNSETAIG